MAKAKSGGTRALLRGKVASDVYSIGKDDKGNRQQIVRALPESVNNPKSRDQVIQRVKMKAVSKMAGVMAEIINHSWEGVEYGTPSVSEFMRRSFAAINEDIANNAFTKKFFFPAQVDDYPAIGLYPVAGGSLVVPASWSLSYDGESYPMVLQIPTGVNEDSVVKVSDIKAALGLALGDYITILSVLPLGEGRGLGFQYSRFFFEPNVADDTPLTGEGARDIESLFRIESNYPDFVSVELAVWGNRGYLLNLSHTPYTTGTANVAAVVLSRKLANGSWGRSDSWLQGVKSGDIPAGSWSSDYVESAFGYSFPEVLDEWEIGRQRFLNGGAV